MLHQKRIILAGLESQKQQMVAALWGNPNWDDNKGTRKDAIDKIEANYEEAIEKIEAIGKDVEEEKIDKENPFFAAADRGLKKLYEQYDDELPKVSAEDEAEYMREVDQR